MVGFHSKVGQRGFGNGYPLSWRSAGRRWQKPLRSLSGTGTGGVGTGGHQPIGRCASPSGGPDFAQPSHCGTPVYGMEYVVAHTYAWSMVRPDEVTPGGPPFSRGEAH